MFYFRSSLESMLNTSSRFKKARVIAPLHTAGPVAATPDGSKLVTCVGEDALLTDVKAGVEICRFAGVSSEGA